MFKNYVKIAYRNLMRHKGYTAINVVGLALGIACCVLIFLYVRNELAVDASIADVERVYRLDSDWREESMGLKIVTAAAAAPTMVAQYPDVEAGVRIYLMTNRIRVGETALRRDVMMADPNVLTFFGLPMVAGDPATALLEPRSVVITDELAQTLFGTTDVLGRPIQVETWQRGEQPFTVTGVREALPYNTATHFRADNEEYDVIVGPEPFGDFFDESGWTSWFSRYILQYASAGQIVLLLSREVTRPVLLAILIATPVAYLLMRQWLGGFAYRAALSWETFAVAGAAALVVAWLTVGYHALRAATAESLRYE